MKHEPIRHSYNKFVRYPRRDSFWRSIEGRCQDVAEIGRLPLFRVSRMNQDRLLLCVQG